MKRCDYVVGVVFLFFVSAGITQEQEATQQPEPAPQAVEEQSPEQEGAQVSEEKEMIPVSLSTTAITSENLGLAVRKYIAEATQKNNGVFICIDSETNEALKLALKKVHDDKLSSLGNNIYVACADFESADGRTYDIDIFMEGTSPTDINTKDVVVHKKNGDVRYKWVRTEQKDGLWVKVQKSDIKKEQKK